MKKILISIIIILLIGLGYTISVKSLNIGALKLESINNIKSASTNLEQKFNTSKEISAQTYPKSIEDLDNVVRDLKKVKQEYEAKTLNNSEAQTNLGVIQVEKYNIEYLWTIIGNYATKNGVTLTLDVKSSNAQDVYNLNFNLEGTYIGITDFIYNLEDDSDLKFEIKDFKISSDQTTVQTSNESTKQSTTTQKNNLQTNTTTKNTTTEQTNTTTKDTTTTTKKKNDGVTLYASFTVENVGINLND